MKIELCPETGLCSIVKDDGNKVDLIPAEVSQLKEGAGEEGKVKAVLGEIDDDFADGLSVEEIAEIASTIK